MALSLNGLPIAVAYWDDPEAVVWVDIGNHRRLQGFDTYWVDGSSYGVWNDGENMGTMYEGAQGFAWSWDGETETEIKPDIPDTARCWRGVMLTDEQARFVGLI